MNSSSNFGRPLRAMPGPGGMILRSIFLGPPVILCALCVELFGIQYREHRGHVEVCFLISSCSRGFECECHVLGLFGTNGDRLWVARTVEFMPGDHRVRAWRKILQVKFS